jgi:hypothetical protein
MICDRYDSIKAILYLNATGGVSLENNPVSNIFFISIVKDTAIKLVQIVKSIVNKNNELKFVIMRVCNVDDLFLSNINFKKSFPKLIYLDLYGNKISNLNNALDSFPSTLIHLDLGGNEIKQINTGSFNGFPFMKFINLDILKLSSQVCEGRLSYIQPRIFKGLHKLRGLDLAWANVDTFDKNTFLHLNNVSNLRLRHSNINFLNDSSFDGLESLKTLDLSAIRINEYKRNCFKNSNIQNLTVEIANGNGNFHEFLFSNMIHLKELAFSRYNGIVIAEKPHFNETNLIHIKNILFHKYKNISIKAYDDSMIGWNPKIFN